MKLTLVHLFPKLMNIYGDRGNILALTKRCEWRGIEIEYVPVDTRDDFDKISSGDLFFFGGGQDRDQMRVWDEISPEKDSLSELIQARVDAHAVFLLICGGYQLFGKYFLDATGHHIPGLGILDMTTVAPGSQVKERCIGNIVIEASLPISPKTLIGFENHGGQTKLGHGLKPLGKVLKGFGDNVTDGVEGCIHKNVYGCYMHGALLPKNPQFADFLISQSLQTKYRDNSISLKPLDDSLELETHTEVIKMVL
ncbi:MAG: glutamine amidotransferase [Candidatus Roizmanbacteria bacterium]